MADLNSIRSGLEARILTVSGLRATSFVPDNLPVPCAVVFPETIEYDLTMGRGNDVYNMVVRVYASKASDRAGQAALDNYIDALKAAIESDKTLGGAADSTRVEMLRSYGFAEVAAVPYFSAELTMEVIASG